MNKKDMLECVTLEGEFIKGDNIYQCPERLGFKHKACEESNSCEECWKNAINTAFKEDMNFKEYQEKALRTAGTYRDDIDMLLNGVMGLNGEAGEVIDIVKKFMFQGHDMNREDILDECGDTLWYIVLILVSRGYTLLDAAKHNIDKLEKRYPAGYFRPEDSVNRKE